MTPKIQQVRTPTTASPAHDTGERIDTLNGLLELQTGSKRTPAPPAGVTAD